jgi:hypothetical protein
MDLFSKISEKDKTWFVITESLKNVKYALNNIKYNIGDHDIFPAKLFTQDNSSSNCSVLTKTDKNSTCYLALTIDKSLTQIPVIYFTKGLGVSESTTVNLIPHQTSSLILSIGLVVISFLFLTLLAFTCYLAVFYTRHNRFPEKIDKWLQLQQSTTGNLLSLKISIMEEKLNKKYISSR